MDIKRGGSQPSVKGPGDWFTGTVRIDPLFQANAPARALAASVTFEPGARTAWHSHPLAQTLVSGKADARYNTTEVIAWLEALVATSTKGLAAAHVATDPKHLTAEFRRVFPGLGPAHRLDRLAPRPGPAPVLAPQHSGITGVTHAGAQGVGERNAAGEEHDSL